MLKRFLFLLIVLSFATTSWVHSQEIQEDRKFLEEKLQELYSQIYDLKKQAKTDSSPELQEEIKKLQEEAKKVEEKIREKIEKGHPEKPDTEEEPDRPNIERQIQQKKKQLKELQKEMEECEDEDEREYLEIYRQKLLEDLARFQKEANPKFQKNRFNIKMPKPQKQDKASRFPERLSLKLQEFLKMLEQENMHEFKNLMKLKEKSFPLFRKHLQELLQDFQEHRLPKKQNPEIAPIVNEINQIEEKVQSIILELENLPKEAKEKKTEELKSLLSQIFDLKIRIQEKEIAEIEKQWQKSKEQLEKRQKNKDIIIEKRLKELLGQGEWDW